MQFPGQKAFSALIATQAAHSFEECYFELWRVYPPARELAGIFGSSLSISFAVLNAVLVTLMVVSLVAFNQRGRFVIPLAILWLVVELINGTNHIAQWYLTGSYFPGVYTAPLLLLFACITGIHVYRQTRAAGA